MLVQRVVRPSVHARRFKYRAFECGVGSGSAADRSTRLVPILPNSTRPDAERSSACGAQRPVVGAGVRGRTGRSVPRVSLVEILEAAGMTKGALYFHFRSKEDLARHIIAEQHRISISAVQAIAAQEVSAIE